MQTSDLVSAGLAILALLVSSFTAYRTFFANFKGKVWISNRIVLTKFDDVPAIGVACFFENSGAKPGVMNDLRIKVEVNRAGASYFFYPILMREDYSIYKAYSEADWFPFSMIPIEPNDRFEKYLILKPLGDVFAINEGDIKVTLQIYWDEGNDWESVNPKLSFSITRELVDLFGADETSALQITSDDIMDRRKM
jgi:hypothetical protein